MPEVIISVEKSWVGERVKGAGAAQRRQHIKLPAHQIVARKGHFHLRLQQHGASFQAAYRSHWAAVQIRSLPLPLGENAIHGVDRG